MDGAQSKLIANAGSKGKAVPFTDLELSVGKALFDIQGANSELAGDLRLLQVRGAREVELAGRKAILLLVPTAQLKSWRRIQSRILHEMEKKLGGGGERSVLLVAYRRIMPKASKDKRGTSVSALTARPRNRTLTAVHEAWLEDLVYPTEIVAKRIRCKTDGSRITKVFLDAKDQKNVEAKTDIMAAVYRKLTGKAVHFEFQAQVSQDDESSTRRK